MVSEFQFVAVLVAIVFGLSLTHLLSSTARAVFATQGSQYGATRWAWTGFVLLILLLNWWVTFSWREIEVWSFDLFLVFIIWAGSHYALVIALFPFNGMGTDIQIADWQPRPMLIMFIIVALLDYAQTAVRGSCSAVRITCRLPCTILCWRGLLRICEVTRCIGLRRGISWYRFLVGR